MKMLSTILTALLLIALTGCSQIRVYGQSPSSPSPRQITTLSPVSERADPYTPHLPPRAFGYHRANRILFFVGMIWHVAGFLLLLRFRLVKRIRDAVVEFQRSRFRNYRPLTDRPSFLIVAGCFIFYSIYFMIWSMPVSLISLAIEHRYGFSHESLLAFLQDDQLSLLVGWQIIPLIWLVYCLHARCPRTWWLWLWGATIPLSIATVMLYPVLISPLFNRYAPLPPGSLRENILSLAAQSGIRGADVFVEDTSRRTAHVNAYVIGIGPTTRIVLNDTALKELPEDQLLAMMAHEMGHYVENHIWIGLAAGSLGTGFLIWLLSWLLPAIVKYYGKRWGLRSLNDISVLPMVLLVIYLLNLAGDPLINGVSRHLEHRADAYGLRTAHLNDATARLFVGFAERDLSDPDPPLLLHIWFGSHPTLSERIAFARSYQPQQ